MPTDPYHLGREVLEDTPWYIPGADNRRGTERSLGFCNPYGYENSDVRVMGGLRNPAHEEYQWQCRNYAQGRYRMTCTNGHLPGSCACATGTSGCSSTTTQGPKTACAPGARGRAAPGN
jgi:hypothetical protein